MNLSFPADIASLEKISFEVRRSVIGSLAEAGSGHLGGSMSSADILCCLYFAVLKNRPDDPAWPERDRFVLSIGHVAPALYSVLAEAGYFPKEELLTLRKEGSRLQGHPGRDHGLPGLELSAGSLGQGISAAVGMALADKIDGLDRKGRKVYCLCGDGELQEGSVWEAAMASAHHKLSNLCVIVDRNGLQIDGRTEEVMGLEPLASKWESFGWKVISCDGHDFGELLVAFEMASSNTASPTIIISKTVMGKGIRRIEGDFRWHGKAPSKEEAEQMLSELNLINS
jgi:transketolase